MFSKEELKLLSSSKALQYLLSEEKPDFRDVVDRLKHERELVKLQEKMIKVQNWVFENGERIIILIEGRDFAGKGGAIRSFITHLNPRKMRLVALGKPSTEEQGQWYFQRYIERLPNRGELVFFDRSWYNRAMVEPANRFCTKEQYKRFMNEVNDFENSLINDGIRIIKFYFSVSKKEQHRRIESIKNNPLRRWELTPVDLKAQKLWDVYTQYKKKMFERTNTKKCPWIQIKADNRRKAYLEAMRYVLKTLPYN